MLHTVKADKSTSSAESSLAVNCNGSLLLFSIVKELVHNVIGGRGTVQEVKVKVLDTCFDELLALVLGFVKSDNQGHSHLLENRNIVLWCE